MNFVRKLFLIVTPSILALNSVYAESPQTINRIEHKFLSADKQCQVPSEIYFKFTNDFTGKQIVSYDIGPKFNVDTDMQMDYGYSVRLPHGHSIVYKNTYTSKQSIMTGAARVRDPKNHNDMVLCSLSFYHFEVEGSCQGILESVGPNCAFLGGEGKKDNPYIISVDYFLDHSKI